MVTLATLVFSCSNDAGDRGSIGSATTVPTGASSSSSSSTTTVLPTTTVASPPGTTSPAPTPEGHARALYEAWASGDRAAAERVAQPDAVAALFARPWQANDGWSFADCSGAAGSVICTWQRPSGQQVLFRVRNVTGGLPVTVSEVRFQP